MVTFWNQMQEIFTAFGTILMLFCSFYLLRFIGKNIVSSFHNMHHDILMHIAPESMQCICHVHKKDVDITLQKKSEEGLSYVESLPGETEDMIILVFSK